MPSNDEPKKRFTAGWAGAVPHLARSGEIADLRSDIEDALSNFVEEYDLEKLSKTARLFPDAGW